MMRTNSFPLGGSVLPPLMVLALCCICWNPATSFSPLPPTRHHRAGAGASSSALEEASGGGTTDADEGATTTSTPVATIDVSDLGLTVDDLQKPIPTEILSNDFAIAASGIESTSRVESVDDGGCLWEESADLIGATLSIEGLRGQPVTAMEVAFSTTTCTVTVFGYAVWSCLLKGECFPESALTKVEDGYDMTPLITLSVAKTKDATGTAPMWGGFIGAIGEDSIL